MLMLVCASGVAASKGAPAELISAREPSIAAPAGGDGSSVAPVLTPDGRFVVFSSAARNLVPTNDGLLGLNVFIRDRLSNSVSLVSVNLSGTGGGNFSSGFGGVSSNGQFVIFESEASDLVPGDTNGVKDIFLRDFGSGSTRLISVGIGGVPANGASAQAAITPDGHWAAFVSEATNLVAGDTNNVADVFVADLSGNTLVRASIGDALPSGRTSTGSTTPVITPDGRYVTFATSLNVLPGPGSPPAEIYVRDMVAGVTTWASGNAAVLAKTLLGSSNFPCSRPALSDDGRFVAFKIGPTNGLGNALILLSDLSAGTTAVISSNALPQLAYADELFGPEITPDGRFVVFARHETTNAAGCSIHLWDSQSSADILVSADLGGNAQGDAISKAPAITPDGRYVIFVSNGTNLTSNAVSNGLHVYLRDIQAGLTRLIDVDTNSVGSTDVTWAVPAMSADGRSIAFSAPDGAIVPGDKNRFEDVFVRDAVAGQTELISKRDSSATPVAGNSLSRLTQSGLSDDSLRLVFSSYARDLTLNDNNEASDVFVRDLVAGTNALVSAGTNGQPALGGSSANPVLSGNGRFVAFVSAATNLVADRAIHSVDMYVRDLDAGTNFLVSASTNGTSGGSGDSSAPLISADGRYVAFLSKAFDLGPGTTGTYWRDLASNSATYLAGSSSTSAPAMSADGRFLAYFGNGSGLVVRDMWQGVTNYTAVGSISSAALSPTGSRLLYTTPTAMIARDLVLASNLFSCAGAVPVRNSNPWSADERYVVFVTRTNLISMDTNSMNDIYLCDLSSKQVTLVSINSSHTGSANGPSDSPVISGDGRFVIYRSFATDIASTPANVPNLYVFDRFTGSNSIPASAAAGRGWSSWVSKPALNGDGSMAIFQSLGSGIVSGEFNRTQDVFREPLVPWGAADTDGDGIPDAWLEHYFGHITGQAGDLSRARDDADGDGMTNLQEYLAGTDPRDAASALRLAIAVIASSNTTATLTWQVSPGKHYGLFYKNHLNDVNWQNAAGDIYVIGTSGYLRLASKDSSRYYRLAVEY